MDTLSIFGLTDILKFGPHLYQVLTCYLIYRYVCAFTCSINKYMQISWVGLTCPWSKKESLQQCLIMLENNNA